MSKGIFITATGTDAGKTYVTALIVKKLKESGRNVSYYKAAVSGNEMGQADIIPGDADYVCRTAGLDSNPSDLVSYSYLTAVSPHLASRLEGNPVSMKVIREDFNAACRRYDYVTMEGSGGIICPIRKDSDETIFLEDIIMELGLSSLIIADAGLGTINSTVLTAEYMKQKGLPVKGIILNHFHEGDRMEEDNKYMIEELTGLPVIACVHDQDTDLRMDAEELAAMYDTIRVTQYSPA